MINFYMAQTGHHRVALQNTTWKHKRAVMAVLYRTAEYVAPFVKKLYPTHLAQKLLNRTDSRKSKLWIHLNMFRFSYIYSDLAVFCD